MTLVLKNLISGSNGIPDRPTKGGGIGYRSHLHVPNCHTPRQRAVLVSAILDAIYEHQAIIIHGSFADSSLYEQVVRTAAAAGRAGDLFEVWNENDRPQFAGHPYHASLQFDGKESYNRLRDTFLFPSVGRSNCVPSLLLHCVENFLNLMKKDDTFHITAETIPDMFEISFLRRIVDGEFGPMPEHMKFVGDYLSHVTGSDSVWNDGSQFGAADHEKLLSEIRNSIARLMSVKRSHVGASIRDVFEKQLICFVWSDASGVVDEFISSDIFHSIQKLYGTSIEKMDRNKRSLMAIGETRRFLLSDRQTCGPSFSQICRAPHVQAVLPTDGDDLPDMVIPIDTSHAPYGPDVVRHVGYGIYRASGTRINPRYYGRPVPFSFRQNPDAKFDRLVRLKKIAIS